MQQKKRKTATEYKEDYPTTCQHCGAPLPYHSISSGQANVSCLECLSTTPVQPQGSEYDLTKNGKILTVPDGLDIIATAESLDIRYSHFQASSKIEIATLTFMNLIWNGTMIAFVISIMQSSDLTMLPFLIFHILAGLAIFYAWAKRFLNYTDILVRDGLIEINTGPIKPPWSSASSVEPGAVKQLYVTRRKSGEINGQSTYSYQLFAILHSGKSIQLTDLASYPLIVYLERRIEAFLGLEDHAITNEHKG